MEDRLSHIERRILAILQGGLPKSRTPYKDMAVQADLDTKQILAVLQQWKRQHKIRRIGAIVNYYKVGLEAGAMVVWQVEPERIKRIGEEMAAFKQVSHAYQRQTAENWPYNLYTMVHAETLDETRRIVQQISDACGVSDYRILDTLRELKKTPPTYIINGE
ncbi:MAG: hypothetical protein JW720_03790 [Sedimentisphaerales bacterium]|nr:hypothetical protein [Sedimentisphaerales bacterium]